MSSASSEVVKEYLALAEDSPDRALLLRRYGRSNVLRLVNAYQEEQLNREWLESSTMACPWMRGACGESHGLQSCKLSLGKSRKTPNNIFLDDMR